MLESDSRIAVGVDVGGHGIKAASVDESGRIHARAHCTLDGVQARGIEHVESEIAQLVAALDPGGTASVGVGVPGFHDQSTGLLRQSPNFPDWDDQPVGARLASRLGRRVVTENDANCALLGEAWTGAARGARNVVMLTLGTGVGSAFLAGGTLVTGATGAGAEAGHITLHRGGRPCGCGRLGCLEAYVSGPGFAETGRDEGAASGATGEHIVRAAIEGDARAARALERFCSDLADGLTQLVHVLSPAVIVIGGGVAQSFEHFAPRVQQLLEERAIPACLQGALPLRQAALGNDAGAVGAARLVATGQKHG